MPSVILIGPPGSGKSSVGKSLAQRLSVSFSDTDTIIENERKKSISDIFIESGEPFFREIERVVVLDRLTEGVGVLSLGGGSVLDDKVQVALRKSPTPIVFLDVSLSSASPRVGFNRDRPLLVGNPRAKWQELMNSRRPIYEDLATFTVVTDELTPSQVSAKIVALLAKED
jgi:shikimate kinase|uniref:shikimate kinase n=1 Tax=Candidatus Planktophila sp. TaxID=2175601 RepID=UPI00404AEA8F